MVIELYLQLAVISRTTSILNNSKIDADQKDYILKLAKVTLKNSRRKFNQTHTQMTKHQDKTVAKVAEYVVKKGGFGFDIIDY